MTKIGTTVRALVASDRITEVTRRMLTRVRALAPQVALALVVPGGFVVALLLWLHKRREDQLRRDALLLSVATAACRAQDAPRSDSRRRDTGTCT
jgi:enhancing lycopene biosynthesis protein 2